MLKIKIPLSAIIIKYVAGIFVYALILCWPAGTIYWTEAWLLIFLQFSYSLYLFFWLKKENPELLIKRMKFVKKDMFWWDKLIIYSTIPLFLALFIIPGLDAVRYQWTILPMSISYIGFVLFIISLFIIAIVMKENTFLSRFVEIQKDSNQTVIDTGLYGYIRHPMYLGVILMLIGIPLALKSLWALIPAILLTIIIIIRIFLEEKTLLKGLQGYSNYTKKVKYRLIPRIF